MISCIIRLCLFLIAAIVLYCAIILLDTGLLPDLVRRSNDGVYPEGYQPRMGLPAILIALLSTIALFRKIVLRKRVKGLLIALGFYISCSIIAFCLLIMGHSALAPAFGWIGIIGLAGYYVVKPFKTPMVSSQPHQKASKDEDAESKFLPPKEWLIEMVPHEDIFNGAIYESVPSDGCWRVDGSPAMVRKNPAYEVFPFSPTDGDNWIKFQQNIQPDDEVWTFSSTAAKLKSPWHKMGVCLIRGGVVIDAITEEAHFHYRG